MKRPSIHFDERNDPDSSRVHGLRLRVSSPSLVSVAESDKDLRAETTGARAEVSGRLLTVEEVAGLLHVPVTWVYGRMRKRSLERLPGYRLGKYWRFREEDVLEWLTRRAR
jgi:excisionase family DNA binding protein